MGFEKPNPKSIRTLISITCFITFTLPQIMESDIEELKSKEMMHALAIILYNANVEWQTQN